MQNLLSRLLLNRTLATLVAHLSSTSPSLQHIPVMKNEILDFVNPLPGQTVLDMTFGTGGHASAFLQSTTNLTCYFLDRDPVSLNYMNQLQSLYSHSGHKIIPLIGQFSDIPKFNLKMKSVDAIIMDLGVSSPQLDDSTRGFGFKHDSLLDMRMNQTQRTHTASDVLNSLSVNDLAQIFRIYGEERFAHRVARAIVDHRTELGPIKTTKHLAKLIHTVIPMQSSNSILGNPIHPATRIFQALRIFVNDELNELCIGLEIAERLLKSGGRLAAVSFHSLEDRLVKWALNCTTSELNNSTLANYLADRSVKEFAGLRRRQKLANKLNLNGTAREIGKWTLVRGPIVPNEIELQLNPRSRSAKLRLGVKV